MQPDPVGNPISAATPVATRSDKSRFYDMGEMVINGEIKSPSGSYTDARQQVKFERLSSLKKSFLPKLLSEKAPRF